MKIDSLRNFDHRNPHGYFADLSPQARMAAWRWLAKFETKWGRDLSRWRRAILIGQAKRLALNPPDSAWGRSMMAKRGGHAVQRKYLIDGSHTTKAATRIRALMLARKRQAEAELERPSRYGITKESPVRVAYLLLD
jgi:hypothetical protein